MTDTNVLIRLVIESITLMTLISFTLSITLQRIPNPVWQSLTMGVVLGIGASVVQLYPISIGNGATIDSRALFVGIAGAFFGFRAACLATILAVATRIYMGGPGTASGVLSLCLAGGAGWVWQAALPGAFKKGALGLLVLGLAINTHLLVPALFLPANWVGPFFEFVGGPLAGSEIIGALVFGALMRREQRLHRLTSSLKQQAMHDPLTGLANRRKFTRRFDKALQTGKPLALFYVDIDHFKAVNDQKGHDAGDKALCDIAMLLRILAPSTATVARVGGEEFCLLIPDLDPAQAQALGETLRSSIARREIGTGDDAFSVTVSIGIHVDAAPKQHDEMMMAADRALYRAKYSGRDRVVLSVEPHRSGSGRICISPSRADTGPTNFSSRQIPAIVTRIANSVQAPLYADQAARTRHDSLSRF